MVVCYPSKLDAWVRFPHDAPKKKSMIKKLSGNKLVTFEIVVGIVIVLNLLLNIIFYIHKW